MSILRAASYQADLLDLLRRGAAAWVTLNRPGKLNALNAAVVAGVRESIARHDPGADPLILPRARG